ncbi:hypothetical protein BVRB_3g056740 [Beta vulgaris subsp. vulgaris]|nr:hypothetical protein BVRB_3g056740 [Beta vulgaris subsp. vulgaris]
MEKSEVEALHHRQVHKRWAILNRTYACLHILAIAAILYYRAAFFLFHSKYYNRLPWLVIFGAELILAFMWILKQSYNWQPVTRTAFPEKLPKDNEALLPGIDVFICTVDPNKEPTFEVMNTVISAMSLDYPAHKLSVYLSDDGGASVTLNAMKHAWVFATWWLPFCRSYNIKPISPKAYFENLSKHNHINYTKEFIQDKEIVKEKYEIFKQRVRSWKEKHEIVSDAKRTPQDHPAIVQVIDERCIEDQDATTLNSDLVEMPFLVYIAREKRPSHPHHFKAGALNVLQRVSSIMSNSPYILVLDCDMYCNDSISARQAMCFYVDSKISRSLAWVQFPQKFHNISETDIYDSRMLTTWDVIFPGTNGLQGPLLAGTNFYINRKALYGFRIDGGNYDINELRYTFGSSNEFTKSLVQNDKPNEMKHREISSDYLQVEAQFLASCVYEEDTQWGKKVGFRYNSVVEDVMTGFMLHTEGWQSVYLNPESPQFLGSATTNLNEALIQGSRWSAGLFQIGLSKYCPLLYTSPTLRLQIFQRMIYVWASFCSLDFLPITCFAIIPPICFFYGIPLYPKVSDPFFIPVAFVFVSSRLKHVCEVLLCGESINAWLNLQRIVMIKGLTCYAYGTLECVMTTLGLRKASFIPTNKAEDDDATKWYQIGKFDFRTSYMFLVPIVTAVILNLFSLVVGVARLIVGYISWDTMFAQLVFSFYVLIISYSVIEGMFLRKDPASIPFTATLISTLLSLVVFCLGYFLLLL